MRSAKERIHEYIEAHESEMIETLTALVAIPSVRSEAEPDAPFGKEPARALAKMLELCENAGFSVKNHENYIGTADFIPDTEPELGILCHLDVVPAGEGWETDPYTLTREGGRLYGRGSADNKGPAVAVLFALRAVKELGLPISKNVRFLFGTDEENGSSDMAYYTQKEKLPTKLFTPDGDYPVINLEKGMIRGEVGAETPAGGKKTVVSAHGGATINAVPAKAEAKLIGFTDEEVQAAIAHGPKDVKYTYEDGTLTVFGKNAHASFPPAGKNAVTALIAVLAGLDTDDGAGELFARAAQAFVHGGSDGNALGLKVRDEKSGALTFAFSIMNFENGKFSGKFDIRFPICENVADIRAKIEEGLGGYGLSLVNMTGVEPHYVPEDSPFIRTLLRVYKNMTGLQGRTIAIGGGTYVHNTEGGVAFGCAFPGENNKMHGAGEYMALGSLKLNAEIFASAILEICK